MTSPTGGLDISSYQSSINPSASSVPLGFVILKASEGNWQDSNFNNLYNESAGRVPVIGAYHYLRSNVPLMDQVSEFLASTAGKNINFYAVDLEGTEDTVNENFANEAKAFLSIVHTVTGKPVFLYTNESIYNSFFVGSGIPLWMSFPGSTPPPTAGWTFWQNSWVAPSNQYG